MSTRERLQALDVAAEIRDAATLPAWVYADPESYALARERVFASSWQFVVDERRLRLPGQLHPFTLLEGCLDEPLLFTRDSKDRLHCLSNVCTHRGNLVCDGEGVANFLRCRYHGRRFTLDGRFHAMPEFDQARGFPSDADHLPQIPFGSWRGFLFAALRPAFPLEDLVSDMESRCGWMPLAEAVFDPTRSREYIVKANWALYCDNYLEGFHIPYIHAALSGALDYGAYRSEIYRWANLQVGIASDAEDAFDLPAGHPDAGQRVAAYYYWLFPNTMFNFYPWGVSVNVVRPVATDRTKVSFLPYVWDPSRLDRGAGSGLDRVQREDEAVVESVQRGVRSRLYDRGRYSPTREQGVHHFHRLLSSFLRQQT